LQASVARLARPTPSCALRLTTCGHALRHRCRLERHSMALATRLRCARRTGDARVPKGVRRDNAHSARAYGTSTTFQRHARIIRYALPSTSAYDVCVHRLYITRVTSTRRTRVAYTRTPHARTPRAAAYYPTHARATYRCTCTRTFFTRIAPVHAHARTPTPPPPFARARPHGTCVGATRQTVRGDHTPFAVTERMHFTASPRYLAALRQTYAYAAFPIYRTPAPPQAFATALLPSPHLPFFTHATACLPGTPTVLCTARTHALNPITTRTTTALPRCRYATFLSCAFPSRTWLPHMPSHPYTTHVPV